MVGFSVFYFKIFFFNVLHLFPSSCLNFVNHFFTFFNNFLLHSFLNDILILSIVDKSSCVCKKVVSDILGEIKFVVNLESTCKMTHFESWYKSQLKVLPFLWTKQDVKK